MKQIYLAILDKVSDGVKNCSVEVTHKKIIESMSKEQRMDIMICSGVRVVDGVRTSMQWLRNGDWIIDPTLRCVESITNNGVVNVEFDVGIQYIETPENSAS
ncbi:hypothetical protein LMH73_006245 [Vibrio splendidus]|nr:hypothetical protein [Vibrio splendidus]MCC4880753.1 hypothetical protein [Vibrio splendidus]